MECPLRPAIHLENLASLATQASAQERGHSIDIQISADQTRLERRSVTSDTGRGEFVGCTRVQYCAREWRSDCREAVQHATWLDAVWSKECAHADVPRAADQAGREDGWRAIAAQPNACPSCPRSQWRAAKHHNGARQCQ